MGKPRATTKLEIGKTYYAVGMSGKNKVHVTILITGISEYTVSAMTQRNDIPEHRNRTVYLNRKDVIFYKMKNRNDYDLRVRLEQAGI